MKLARSVVPTFVLSVAGLVGTAAVMAEPPGRQDQGPASHGESHRGPAPAESHKAQAPRGEAHQGPRGYRPVQPPKGWNAHPKQADPHVYNHNFQASKSYHIGAYRRPPGWVAHRWVYGETLPRLYWGPEFMISDYWLFALEVPPAGYAWVRDDTDALLINTATGVILQVEYGVFG